MSVMLDAEQVSELLGVSVSKSYSFIRQMNQELASAGYLTVRGKVPQSYLERRFFGYSSETEGDE